jgi:hypothetical protein
MTAAAASLSAPLHWVTVPSDDEVEPRATAFRDGILAASASLLVQRAVLFPVWWLIATAALALAALSARRRPRLAAALGVIAALVVPVVEFPATANHVYLLVSGAIFVLFFTFVGTPALKRDLVCLARWMAVIPILGAGLQKLAYGSYDHGEFFAYFLTTERHPMATLLASLVPARDLAALPGATAALEGQGALRLTSWPSLVLSNTVLAAELVLPLAVLHRRTRAVALPLMFLFMAAVALASRELGFCVTLSVFLALFTSVETARNVPGAILVYTLAVLALHFVDPNAVFT